MEKEKKRPAPVGQCSCCSHEHEYDENHENRHDHNHSDSEVKLWTLPFSVGAVLFIFGLLLEHTSLFEAIPKTGVTIIFLVGYLLVGKEVLIFAGKNILRGYIFDENFLMAIASIGAFIIGQYEEAVGVMLFYSIGEYLQDKASGKSQRSIRALMDVRPDTALLKRGNDFVRVAAEEVAVGDIVQVRVGERIPLDGVIISGSTELDMRALSGESVPVFAGLGSEVYSGSVNTLELIEIKVQKEFTQSTASKIVELAQNAAGQKSKTEKFITTFSKYYTPAVCALALVLACVPPLIGLGDFSLWGYRGLVFLVASCPCALIISVPLGYFGGIGRGSSVGVLIKGGNYLEALAKINTLVVDKTGTLTKGSFKVNAIRPVGSASDDELLASAYLAENLSTHPIAISISKEALARNVADTRRNADELREVAGKGVVAKYGVDTIVVGTADLILENIGKLPTLADIDKSMSAVFVAKNGEYLGYICISDELREDSMEAIKVLRDLGVKNIVMLTGDNENEARRVAGELGIDKFFAKLLPEDKVKRIKELITTSNEKDKVAFVGDGINDAPVLAISDVGIAMGGVGSDAAIEAADVVIMNDSLMQIANAMKIARHTKRIVAENIIFALGIKAGILILASFGFAGMWAAVFADVGVALLATLNSLRAGRI
jgi:Cd2+/Zn2+-exporting ATPase